MEHYIHAVGMERILNNDFAVIKVSKKQKCFSRNCNSSPSDTAFYLTEWELMTGASTDGLIYCEKCIKEYLDR